MNIYSGVPKEHMSELGLVPRVLTIAGSDSGAGAGIQADLKTFASLGTYGTSVITSVTAQNTLRVDAIHEIPATIVASQIRSVLADIGADAVKTGMLSNRRIIETVARELTYFNVDKVVVDPVMIAKSGDRLLRMDSVKSFIRHMLPIATVVTPNIPEAETLAAMSIHNLHDAKVAAQKILLLGAKAVVVKGGHLPGAAVDVLFWGDKFVEFEEARVTTKNTHGTGCTFASAIAAELAKGSELTSAVGRAKEFVTGALHHSYNLGSGHGPLNHFYQPS